MIVLKKVQEEKEILVKEERVLVKRVQGKKEILVEENKKLLLN